MKPYIKVRRIRWIPGILCFQVLETNVPHMRGRRYTVNDLHVIRSYMELRIRRERRR